MPKVSEQYLTERREQILVAARRCFTRNGFHQTSMQDLFAESGLSAGAVYRYFASKDDMVLAIAANAMAEVIETVLAVASAENGSVGEGLAAAIELLESKDDVDGLGGLAVQVWAEALRNPDLAERFVGSLRHARGEVTGLVRAEQKAGRLPAAPAAEAESIAAVLTAILPGYLVQRALLGPESLRGVPAAVRALWPPATASA